MKVYMGPYPNYITFRKTFKWVEKVFGENAFNFLDDYVGLLFDKCVSILNKEERKIKVRIDDYDVWSASETMASIIHPMLVKLKESKHGSPTVDFEDVPEELHPDPKELATLQPHDSDSKLHLRWEWVLDEMIWAFEQVNLDWEDQYRSGNVDWHFIKLENGYSEMVTGPNHTYTVDDVGVKKHRDRIENGIRLFAKYYFALWD